MNGDEWIINGCLECEQNNFHEGIQENRLAELESWRWKGQDMHYYAGEMGMLQSKGNLLCQHTSGKMAIEFDYW